jgi:methyl-accepting chemotaxis protein
MKNLMARILKRRSFVVYRKLQITLVIMSFSYVILFCVVMGAYLFIPLMMELDNSDMGSAGALLATNRILYLHEKFWPALLLSLFVIGCHSIFISHKIAGPLYRFNLIFKAIKEGTVPAPIRLRRGDYLHREMENINQMLEGLRDKLTELQETQAHLNRSIIKCNDTVSHSSKNELIKEIEDLVEEGKKLEENLGYFKVIS